MTRTSFNDGWRVRPLASVFTQLGAAADPGRPVTLPHDAMLEFERRADAPGESGAAYFPGGAVSYTKTITVPASWAQKRVSVEFESVYRDAVVFVNGAFAAQRPFGYSRFRVDLDPFLILGAENIIRVDARAHVDSRWYSGLGITRDTFLVVEEATRIAENGHRVSTPDVDTDRAVVVVDTVVRNDGIRTTTARVRTHIADPSGNRMAATESPVTVVAGTQATSRHRLYVPEPLLWGVDTPHLYTATTEVVEEDRVSARSTSTFGIRTLRIDPTHGLRLNGETVTLRGTCLHQDSGLLGAAVFSRAEERRIALLKEAGFNAIRSAHNPLSERTLEACDRLGMLVMDEAFDMWLEGKNAFDYSLAFPEWWERDVEAMVAKDFNHPSVIMYSIGNEILDVGRSHGAVWARRLADKVRSLDSHRFVTNGISGFVATISDTLTEFQEEVAALSGGNVNDVMEEMADLMDSIGFSDSVTTKTEEAHSVVDVVGHNYAHSRYEDDRSRFPDRVVVGTESWAKDIAEIWGIVSANPHVIGDFTWTGWDYLGEVGLGGTYYTRTADDDVVSATAFPALLAWCGDIDITGHRRPASYFREIVFGLRDAPYIAVVDPRHAGETPHRLKWGWSDSSASWTWKVPEGTPVEIEVYSGSAVVELFLNGRSMGRARAGEENGFIAHFRIEYEAGELLAIASDGEVETGRCALRSASRAARLAVTADRHSVTEEEGELVFVAIELVDDDSVLFPADDRRISVDVSGAGLLKGLGSARPVSSEGYTTSSCTTFAGRAQAIVQPTGLGTITIVVSTPGLESETIEVHVAEGTSEGSAASAPRSILE